MRVGLHRYIRYRQQQEKKELRHNRATVKSFSFFYSLSLFPLIIYYFLFTALHTYLRL